MQIHTAPTNCVSYKNVALYQYAMYYSEGTCNKTWETSLQTAWCSRWHLYLSTQATYEM